MNIAASSAQILSAAGLGAAAAEWSAAGQASTSDLANDTRRHGQFWKACGELLARLPKKTARNNAESAAADAILHAAREHRERFLTAHAEALYDRLTANRTRFVRLEKLVYDAAAVVPGLTPTKEQVA